MYSQYFILLQLFLSFFLYYILVVLLASRSYVFEGVRKVGKQPKTIQGHIRSFHKMENSIGSVVFEILSYRKKPYYFIIRKCCMFMPRLKSAELATLMFIYSHHCRQLANLEQNRIYAPPQFYTFKHFSLKGFEKILFFWSRKDFLAKL